MVSIESSDGFFMVTFESVLGYEYDIYDDEFDCTTTNTNHKWNEDSLYEICDIWATVEISGYGWGRFRRDIGMKFKPWKYKFKLITDEIYGPIGFSYTKPNGEVKKVIFHSE